MKKILMSLGLAASFGLSVGAQNYNLSLVEVNEIDSLTNEKFVALQVKIKNNGDFFPYMALRAVVDSTVIGKKDGYFNSYGTLSGQTEIFEGIVLARPLSDGKKARKIRLVVESAENTMSQKFEFEYQPKPYKAPKTKKQPKEKAVRKAPTELKVIEATPPSKPE